MQRKVIIVVNGKGGCGKDTLIKMFEKFYPTFNVNSVLPYKIIAKDYGYDENDKSDKWRKFLSDLKRTFEDAGVDLSLQYTIEQLEAFLHNNDNVMFVHIREGKNIDKFIDNANKFMNSLRFPAVGPDRPYITTLLIKRKETDEKTYGNASDDDVENYKYNLVYENSKPENIAGYDFMIFAEENIIPLIS